MERESKLNTSKDYSDPIYRGMRMRDNTKPVDPPEESYYVFKGMYGKLKTTDIPQPEGEVYRD